MKNVTQIRLPQSNAVHYTDKNVRKDNDDGIITSVHKSNANTMILGRSGNGMAFNRKMANLRISEINKQ